MKMTTSWKLTLPCTRAEAESLNDDVPALALLEPQPAILTQELKPFDDQAWELVAYFDSEPDDHVISTLMTLLPSSKKAAPTIEKLGDEDWVTMSQSAIEPTAAGRFYVHTAANKGDVPPAAVALQIEASRAFGTGSHETTAACLTMLDHLKSKGRRFSHVADIGTGTGLLAFAAMHLWPNAQFTASDIDPVSIDVTMDNAAVNDLPLGKGLGQVALCVAPGADHGLIQRRAPYDLLIANILAGPLIALAPSLVAILEDGGTLILAGLLDTQMAAVISAYRKQGMRLDEIIQKGDWPCLRMTKRRRYGWRRPRRALHIDTPPGDFGTW